MKQRISLLTVITLVVLLLASPLATHAVALEATTKPYTTTTTTWVWDCISTTPPMTTTTTGYPPSTIPTTWPPTTDTTTLNLTGPDGMDPNRTTWPTTTATTTVPDDVVTDPTHPVTIDLLSTAYLYEQGNISILANPNYGGEWMSADCYTYDGASVSVQPQNGGPWDIKVLRYLHVTVTTNVPFALQLVDMAVDTEVPSLTWFADALGTELVDGWLPAGKYVGVIDLYDVYTGLLGEEADVVDLAGVEVLMSKPGSITVGHIALSPDPVCTKTAPEIQTTTIPKFPTTGTTTTQIIYTTDTTTQPTTTTTAPPPTSGGTTRLTTTTPSSLEEFYKAYDINEDGNINMFDCLDVYQATSGANRDAVDPARCDFNGDGTFNMLDCLIFLEIVAG